MSDTDKTDIGSDAATCSASSCGNLWIIQLGDSVEVVRRNLLTATEPPLTRYEMIIGLLCEKIILPNA